MFKIGEFSRLSQTTVKTLHHYDSLGLLKPAEVDPHTGYRYYTVAQIPRLNRILALRDLGFSLEQIARLLDERLSYETLCEIMRMKQTELEQRVKEEQTRLARVAVRLRLIQLEGMMSTHEVMIRNVPAQRVVSMREVMPSIPHMVQRISDVLGILSREHIQPTGPLMTLFYHDGFREQDLESVMHFRSRMA